MENENNKDFENIEETVVKIKKCKTVFPFISSIISILTLPFWYLSLPLGIYGLVGGIKVNKKTGLKLSKTAFILSLVSLTLFLIIYSQTILVIYWDILKFIL